MSTKDDGGPAFPLVSGDGREHTWGMSLRDYFAAQALIGVTGVLHEGVRPTDLALLARDCYGIADAMLAERSKP